MTTGNWQQALPHLGIVQWLEGIELHEYAECFHHNQGVEELLYLEEGDIKALGVRNGAHRAKIVSSLVMLRNKYERMTGISNKRSGASTLHRSSSFGYSTKDIIQSSPRLLGSQPVCSGKESKSYTSALNQCGMEPVFDPSASPQQLRRALEWELGLDKRDLRSNAWYHGSIPRGRAEELVLQDGDFLIRDCISQPGDYVLTNRWKSIALHFVINKVVIQPNTVYERIQFTLEDDSYDTVPDLVTCYVGSGKPLSLSSGAKVIRPVNRSMPLSFYATHYSGHCHSEIDPTSRTGSPMPSIGGGSSNSTKHSPENTPRGGGSSPVGSPPMSRRLLPLPSLPPGSSVASSTKDDYAQLINADDDDYPHHSSVDNADGIQTMVRRQQQLCHLVRAGSDPMLSPRLERRNPATNAARWVAQNVGNAGRYHANNTHDTPENAPHSCESDAPPPKPSRTPSVKYSSQYSRRPYAVIGYGYSTGVDPSANSYSGGSISSVGCIVLNNSNNESDSGTGSGDSIHSADILLSGPHMTLGSVKRRPGTGHDRRRPLSDTRYSFLDRRSGGGSETDSAYDEGMESAQPTMLYPLSDPPTLFDLSPTTAAATSIAFLLPSPDNKPLDPTARRKVGAILAECGPRVLAAHLTRVDLDILRFESDADLGLGVTTGLELITLPYGRRMRLDLLERTDCMKLLVAVTILTCLSETERTHMLRKWIEIAVDTKTALGNLYSFTSIMLGLGIPQIQRLKATWSALRLNFTETAFTYETKLRPTLKAMNECSNPQAPNTTIPHLLPLVVATERAMEEGPSAEARVDPKAIHCSFPWELSSSDYGTNLLLAHLDNGRNYVNQVPSFQRNGQIVLENAKYEELLLTMFRTEFHLRFLWGSKGAIVGSAERHAKFEQVLSAMSERCESS